MAEHRFLENPSNPAADTSEREQILDVNASSSGVTYQSDEVPFVQPAFAGRVAVGGRTSADEDIVSPSGPFQSVQNVAGSGSYLQTEPQAVRRSSEFRNVPQASILVQNPAQRPRSLRTASGSQLELVGRASSAGKPQKDSYSFEDNVEQQYAKEDKAADRPVPTSSVMQKPLHSSGIANSFNYAEPQDFEAQDPKVQRLQLGNPESTIKSGTIRIYRPKKPVQFEVSTVRPQSSVLKVTPPSN